MQPYLDHVLGDEEMAEVERHLSVCADCRRRYRFEESLRVYVGQARDRLDNPDEPEAEGGVGDREPRRPKPSGWSGAAALPIPDSDQDS